MKFSGICLVTKDVLALVDFYQKVLEVEAQGDATHMELTTQGGGIAIFSTAGMEGMAPASMQGAGSGSVTLMFAVEDIEAHYARLQAQGVAFVKPLQIHPWGSRSFWFRDPDGNMIDFYQTVGEG
jgi:uncharacterized glyoxalase superfamily protein PhnB